MLPVINIGFFFPLPAVQTGMNNGRTVAPRHGQKCIAVTKSHCNF